MGDSIMATMDTYDQQVWAVGKGPSATTVIASPKVSAFTGSILMKLRNGYIPGTEEYGRTTRFPNVFQQFLTKARANGCYMSTNSFECPTTASGVEVVIEVLDSTTTTTRLAEQPVT